MAARVLTPLEHGLALLGIKRLAALSCNILVQALAWFVPSMLAWCFPAFFDGFGLLAVWGFLVSCLPSPLKPSVSLTCFLGVLVLVFYSLGLGGF